MPRQERTERTVILTADGRIRFVWDDALAGLCDEGTATVARAGDVEPAAGGGWVADLARVDGGLFGPFRLRGDALAAERMAVERMLEAGEV